jgi:hypothetical protein
MVQTRQQRKRKYPVQCTDSWQPGTFRHNLRLPDGIVMLIMNILLAQYESFGDLPRSFDYGAAHLAACAVWKFYSSSMHIMRSVKGDVWLHGRVQDMLDERKQVKHYRSVYPMLAQAAIAINDAPQAGSFFTMPAHLRHLITGNIATLVSHINHDMIAVDHPTEYVYHDDYH